MMNIEESWKTPNETAIHIGVTVGTVRLWCGLKGLPHVRLGRDIRMKFSQVDAWLEEGQHGRRSGQGVRAQGKVPKARTL